MKSYNELKSEVEAIVQQFIEVKESECANQVIEIKYLSKEYVVTSWMLNNSLINKFKNK